MGDEIKPKKPAPSFIDATLINDRERALWRALHLGDVKPLPNKKQRNTDLPKPKPASYGYAPAQAGAQFHVATKLDPRLRGDVQKGGMPALSELSKKQKRRISRGHHELDARIDLHGMRQEAAHTALKRFLLNCFQQGHKNVLVITGKGSVSQPSVLRQNLPIWLNTDSDISTLVISLTPASAAHGGAGAFYLELRRQKNG